MKKIFIPLFVILGMAGGIIAFVKNKDRQINQRYYFLRDNVVNLLENQVEHKTKGGVYFLSGEVTSRYPVEDPLFLVPINVLAIKRNVETLLWQENLGKDQKSVDYKLVWSEKEIDSRGFVTQGVYLNPRPTLASAEFYNRESYVENYSAKETIKWESQLSASYLPLSISEKNLKIRDSQLDQSFRSLYRRVDGNYLYFEKIPRQGSVGDVRISWSILEPGVYSFICSKQIDVLVKVPLPDNSFWGAMEKGIHRPEDLLHRLKVKKSFWELLLH